jgi:FkbM family methyltransferase
MRRSAPPPAAAGRPPERPARRRALSWPVLALAAAALAGALLALARPRWRAAPRLRAAAAAAPDFCSGAGAPPPAPGASVFVRVALPDAAAAASATCHWSPLRYPALDAVRPRLALPLLACLHDPAVDLGISAAIVQHGGFVTNRTLAALLAAGPCSAARPYALDVGANVGAFTLLAAALGCHVIAVEPLEANLARLAASVAAAGLGHRVTLLRNAVSNAPGAAALRVTRGNSGGNQLATGQAEDPDAEEVQVQVVTLDDLLLRRGATAAAALPLALAPRTCAVIKVDTEGHDAAVVAGGRAALAAGGVPLLQLEWSALEVVQVARCDPARALAWLWDDAGYGGALSQHAWEPLPPRCDPAMQRVLAGLRRAAADAGLGPRGGGGSGSGGGGAESESDEESEWPALYEELVLLHDDAGAAREALLAGAGVPAGALPPGLHAVPRAGGACL